MRGRVELGRKLRINGDHHVFLFLHLDISILNLLGDPLPEDLANHGRTNIDNPLFGHFWHIFLVREVLFYTLLLAGEGQDLRDREVLVLRYI